MSTEIETPPSLPAFARPTSLYLPDVSRTTSLLDTTSYSPFPTFPGSVKTRDPYGLNAYLLHPNDSLWSYVDPIPQPTDRRESPRSASLDGQEKNQTPPKRVRKQRSLSLLKRPSPLGAQPPVSAEVSENEDEAPEFLVRRRSSSIGSSPKLSIEEAAAIVATFRDEATKPKTPKPKKSIRKAFGKARKSVFGLTSGNSTSPPVPALPEASTLVAPSLSVTLSEDLPPSTPMSSRSNSNYSTASSASSTSSSEGVKTPGEGVPIEIAITGTRLANALQEVGGSKKGKNWSRWLGGKKSKLSAKEMGGSGFLTPGSDSSTSTTPNSSSPDLLAGITAKLSLTPSPAIITPPSKTTPLIPSSEQLGRQHTWATEQLRRISIRKITQLKAQSPHPLAMALRRQHSRLPEEVASHITAGQRVFPMSVNSFQGADGDLGPAQGGLWLNLAVGGVIIKLTRGEQPEGLLKTRKTSKRSIVPRPRGVHDFITRPPFEERNIVFYPDNVLSPISMARPGYGVWDLDFSPYILALSEVDEPPPSWPNFPRASIAVSDELAEIIKATTETIEEEAAEMLDSPTFKTFAQASEATLTALSGTAPASEKKSPTPSITSSPRASPKPEQHLLPESSFRNLTNRSKSPMSSSNSSSEESAEESDADDEPLAQLAKRRSLNFQPQPRPQSQSQCSPDLLARPEKHVRSISQPPPQSSEKKLVKRQISQHTAMEQVARARERREENLSGVAERRAEAEQMQMQLQLQAGRRSSLVNLKVPSPAAESRHHRRASSGGNLLPSASTNVHSYRTQQEELSRRRISSGLPHPSSTHLQVHRPEATRRGRSNPDIMQNPNGSTSSLPTRRYHSFYEKSSSSSSPSAVQRLPLPQQQQQQAFIHPRQYQQQQEQQRMSIMIQQQQHQQIMMIPPQCHHHQQQQQYNPRSQSINGRSNRSSSSSKMT